MLATALETLIWRICRNYLPTMLRLQNRGINYPANCALRDEGMQDDYHVFSIIVTTTSVGSTMALMLLFL